MTYNFFAAITRMKYIERWALMRNSRPENLCEHAMEVAMIAHALCVIGNERFHKNLNADRAAVVGLYHDAAEIITGDMPTPVKYYSDDMRQSYKQIEAIARLTLLNKLPDDLRPAFEGVLREDASTADDEYMLRLVKAADKLSALIKCIEEEKSGNGEFSTAKLTIQKSVGRLCGELEEVKVFVEEFLPPYGNTLDELQS